MAERGPFLSLKPRRADASEFLDEPMAHAHDLPGNLAEIRFLNRRFGGTKLMLQALTDSIPAGEDFSLLDVACGSGDIPLAVWEEFSSRGQRVQITALDSSAEILVEARKVVGRSSIDLLQGDARRLPFAEGSFDVVTCSLALHHFSPLEARLVLTEMWRVARRVILLADLTRSWMAYLSTLALTRLLVRNRLTRHDAPLSVQRAYTRSEMLELAAAAGISKPRVSRAPFFRQILIARKPDVS